MSAWAAASFASRSGFNAKVAYRDFGEGRARGGDGFFDVFRRVRVAHESGLERRRRKIKSAPQHSREKSAKALFVDVFRFGQIVGRRRAKMQTEHAAQRARAKIDFRRLRRVFQPRHQRRRKRAQPLVKARLRGDFERRQARRQAHRIAGQSPRLIHRAERRKRAHHFAPPAENRQRQAAAGDLAQANQIGANAKKRRRPAGRDSKSGHHFVENQNRPRRVAMRA